MLKDEGRGEVTSRDMMESAVCIQPVCRLGASSSDENGTPGGRF
jgi:hypothetical protein